MMSQSSLGITDNEPKNSRVALIIIDMINDLEFPGGAAMLDTALAVAKNIAQLKSRARRENIPVIYANDNFGRWRSSFTEVVSHCLRDNVPGRVLAQMLAPTEEDYFILKPRHSAFYATPLEQLLLHLGSRRLILCGISGSMCVQFTACDAYIRNFGLYVPEDCSASRTPDENRRSLEYMERVLGVDTTRSGQLNLSFLRDDPASESDSDP